MSFPMNSKRHEELKKLVSHHDYLYHVLDKPDIADFEYDKLYQELLALENANPALVLDDSPTQRVGSLPLDSFSKKPHRLPMVSLSNTYNVEEIVDFEKKVSNFFNSQEPIEYFCEPKFDGLAMELVYEKGALKMALTRGDGSIGEDVTHNIRTIRSIPLRLKTSSPPDLFEVRGEVLIFKNDFLKMNSDHEELGLGIFANPRNAAAGTMRQLDSKIAASRPLRFFAYGLGAVQGLEFDSQEEIERQLASFGFPIASEVSKVCKGSEEVVLFYQNFEKIRPKLKYEADGIVIKVNSLKLQKDLGFIAKSPRWAVAAKFKPEQAETLLEDIQLQVGRTGAITPVAILKSTRVGGVQISSATLHNQEEIRKKDVRIGDTVVIQRAGDVIPEVVGVVLSKRPTSAQPFQMPLTCPSCSENVFLPEGEIVLRCLNPFCKAILKESLKHFVSRRAMNIEKVGDRLIDSLVDAGLVKSFSDLYKLTPEQLLSLDRQGEKSVQNILDSVSSSKKPSLGRFIFSLGIRFVGEQTAKLLADHFGSIEKLMEANEEELVSISEIGPRVAQSILHWFSDPKNVDEIHSLLGVGVQLIQVPRTLSGALAGKTFLITGTLPVSRDHAKSLIEQNGGKTLSSISSKLNFLVVGNDPGSKLKKAENLNVPIVSWDDLQNMLK